MRPGGGVAGEDVHPVYAVECRDKYTRIVEVEQDRVETLGVQSLHILLLPGTYLDARVTRVADELLQNMPTGLTGGVHEEHEEYEEKVSVVIEVFL